MNQSEPDKVAIVLSTYNGALYIEAQLQALIAQSYKNWCCYIRDDGSKDSSVDIIRKYVSLDSRFIFLDDGLGNMGLNPSHYHLLKLAKENYIATCDQDDVWHPNKLELSLKRIKEIETADKIPALVHTNSVFVDSNLNVIRQAFLGKRALRKGLNSILFANTVQGGSILINQSLNKIAVKTPPDSAYDYHLGVISELVGVRAYIPDTLLKYRQHSASSIASGDRNMQQNHNSTLSPSLLLSLAGYSHLKNDFKSIQITNQKSVKALTEYYYLFEGKNPLKKLYIAIKNLYPFYRKKDYIDFLLLIIRNKNLIDVASKRSF